MSEKITFQTEDGGEDFYVLEETKLFGRDYILVTPDMEREDAEFLILRKENEGADGACTYAEVEDENELKAVVRLFDELLDDIDLEV